MNEATIKDTPKIQYTKAWPMGLVSICGYCYPGKTIFDSYQWLSTMQVSHGICKDCMQKELTKLGIVR